MDGPRNLGAWNSGDEFDLNWKQVLDSDDDGYGDNSGPDCCATSHSSQDDAVPDLFHITQTSTKIQMVMALEITRAV